jgi:diguanylate cyclase (GGDEF)-like protein
MACTYRVDVRSPRQYATPVEPRLLVVDASKHVRDRVAQLGKEKRVAVVSAATPNEAMGRAREGPLHLALIDGALERDALCLARDLRALPNLERLPLAFLSDEGHIEHRVAAVRAGASAFLRKPIDPYAFGAAVDEMLALSTGSERMRILVIDDDANFVATVAAVLEADGLVVRTAPGATHLIEVLEESRPDLVLIDAMLPTVSGWDAVRVIRTLPEWRDVPILFLTGRTDVESRVSAFDAGADDYLAKPCAREELLARVRVRLDRRRLMRQMTECDALTRCLSRGALLNALAVRLSEARRHARVLSLALLDVDRFKDVNDAHGHLVGDRVLAGLGRLLCECFRLEDLRGRWGGEEFVIAFPNLSEQAAGAVLSRVLEEFRSVPFRSDRGGTFFVTFSAGIASYPVDGASLDSLIRAADRRLYHAKRAGRARVITTAERASL